MPYNLASKTAEGYSLGSVGEYTGGAQYPLTCPYGDVDTNSLFYGQTVIEGDKFRIVSIAYGTIDTAAGEAQVPPWSGDIRDIYTPPGNYFGPVLVKLERESEVT